MGFLKPLLEGVGLGRLTRSHRERLAFQHLRGNGIEIGALGAPLPVPPGAHVRYVDNTEKSVNEAKFQELSPERIVRTDILADGFTLGCLDDRTMDFVIANHVLEHAPDAIGVLAHWLRVLRPGGVLYAAVPLAEGCFDRGRPITPLEHFLDDHRLAGDDPAALHRKNLEHYREWLRVSEPNIYQERRQVYRRLSEPEIAARAVELQIKDPEIHFHAFSPSSYAALLHHVAGKHGAALEECSVAPNGFESIGIVRKA